MKKLFILIFNTAFLFVTAQEAKQKEKLIESKLMKLERVMDSLATVNKNQQELLQKKENENHLTNKEIYDASQNNIDRALNIQSTSATFIEILSGLIALILTAAGLFGFFEYRRWKQITKEMSTDLKFFKGLKKKTIAEIDSLRNSLKPSDNVLNDEPSKEALLRIDDLNKKLTNLELLGVSFKPDDYINRGNDLFYKNDYVNAIQAYDKAIELDPNNFNAWNNKAISYNKISQFEKSVEATKQAIEIDPKRSEVWNTRGASLYGLNNLDEALGYFLKSIELNKSNIHPYVNSSRTYNKQGKHQEALEYALEALKINPNYENALIQKGIAEGKLGNTEEAHKTFEFLTVINPNSFSGWKNKAIASNKLRNFERSLIEINEALRIKPKSIAALDLKVFILINLNRIDEASEVSEIALAIDPQYPSSLYNRACIFGLKNNPIESASFLKKAITKNAKYLDDAKEDKDFDLVRDSDEFKQIFSD